MSTINWAENEIEIVRNRLKSSPEGEKINIERYFKDVKGTPGWVEINSDEYLYRMYHQFRRNPVSEMMDDSKN